VLLNHERATPHRWDDAVPSLCPDCRERLTPRRGRVLAWHWAHPSSDRSPARPGCHGEETAWHLTWKTAYLTFPGWRVEEPVVTPAGLFRADAYNPATRRIREFVHSLSEAYVAKHLALTQSAFDVLWLFDGEQFVAERRRPLRGGAYRHLLKPKARWLHGRIGGLVHWSESLWREWKGDVWYSLAAGRSAELLIRFAAVSPHAAEQSSGAKEDRP
jgi:hypothetical protein